MPVKVHRVEESLSSHASHNPEGAQEGASGHSPIPRSHGAPTLIANTLGPNLIVGLCCCPHSPPIFVCTQRGCVLRFTEGAGGTTPFRLEKAHFRSCFCSAEVLAEQCTAPAWLMPGTGAVAGAEPTHGAH